jgi:hypothetical protein
MKAVSIPILSVMITTIVLLILAILMLKKELTLVYLKTLFVMITIYVLKISATLMMVVVYSIDSHVRLLMNVMMQNVLLMKVVFKLIQVINAMRMINVILMGVTQNVDVIVPL